MKNSGKVLRAAARNSRLSVIQSENALRKLRRLLPSLDFELVPMSSPGDRDRSTDLRIVSADFFSRDIDDAITSGEVDFAIHSAKDLPYELYCNGVSCGTRSLTQKNIDWFWLPWKEDARDAVVLSPKLKNNPAWRKLSGLRVGISSERREKYVSEYFNKPEILPIRGNIEHRLEQLDEGKYDLLIMASAALHRLGLQDRIAEYIDESELPPPAGQGVLAVTFRADDRRFCELRKLFVHPVVFAGAGVGSSTENATLATVNALKECDVCLYDALAPEKLLDNLPSKAEAVFVGKRANKHSYKQSEICELIAKLAREGRSVVRLKGGDPTIFGRLAEEVEILDSLSLPFRVLPGISSLQTAVADTGLLLTRRGVSRGFTVLTPRKSGSAAYSEVTDCELRNLPKVFFMGASVIQEITASMLKQGASSDEPAAVVFAAGTDSEKVITGNIANIAEKVNADDSVKGLPGLLFIGKTASSEYLFKNHGLLAGQKVLVTSSETIAGKAVCEIRRFGGLPVLLPMIKTVAVDGAGKVIREVLNSCDRNATAFLFTSPSSVRIFMCELRKSGCDIRKLPQIITCGPGTSCEFSKNGIYPDIEATENFGSAGVFSAITEKLDRFTEIVRWCSDRAGEQLTCDLSNADFSVRDELLYRTIALNYEECPDFDCVLFTSPSAVRAFVECFGTAKLEGKIVGCIGNPTADAVKKYVPECRIIVPEEPTVAGMVTALAAPVQALV